MAKGKSGETRLRPGMSAWLAVGLALGWLAVLGTFVRGVGSLLTAWAATTCLVVLMMRRSSPVSSGAGTAHHPAALTAQATPESGPSTSASAPCVAPGPDETGSADTSYSPAAPSPDLANGPGAETAPAPTAQPEQEEAARTLGIQVLTAAEVASVLRVDVDAIILAIGSGELPGNRIGSHWRVNQEALIRWLQGTYGNSVG